MEIHAQIERLQRQNRLLRLGGIALMMTIVVGMIKGCSGSEPDPRQLAGVVEAQRFIVRDTDGTERAVLGLLDGNRLYLSMRDSAGKQRAAVGVEDDGPSVKLYNARGEVQAVLDLLNERPRLTLFDDEGHISHKVP